jgi:hypothetical protein
MVELSDFVTQCARKHGYRHVAIKLDFRRRTLRRERGISCTVVDGGTIVWQCFSWSAGFITEHTVYIVIYGLARDEQGVENLRSRAQQNATVNTADEVLSAVVLVPSMALLGLPSLALCAIRRSFQQIVGTAESILVDGEWFDYLVL